MLPNSFIKVFYIFTIVGFIAESTMKCIKGTKYMFFEDAIFETKNVW